VVKEGEVVSLNRFEAEFAANGRAGDKSTLFEQLFGQLKDTPRIKLRRRDRAFRVKFIGESSDDHGGPYREVLTVACAELQSEASELLVLCPNGQHALGSNRSSYLLRPASTSPAMLERFAFLGLLTGCSLVQSEAILDLELCEHVWKRLVGCDLDELDLAAFDQSTASSLAQLRHIDEQGIDAEMFGELFFNTFEAQLSDGSMAELCADGAAVDVTFASRARYCDLVIEARLAEGASACEAMRAGIASIVPGHRLLSLLTAMELQQLVCGVSDVDLDVLRSHTRYGVGVNAGQKHIRFFWQVLESFTPAERRLFLTFIWGRNRLPLTERDWGSNNMKLHTLETRKPNDHLPVAHTCFFSIEWPQYKSFDIARAKLLYAITNCRGIDADNTQEARTNAIATWIEPSQ